MYSKVASGSVISRESVLHKLVILLFVVFAFVHKEAPVSMPNVPEVFPLL